METLDFNFGPGRLVAFVYVDEVVFVINENDISRAGFLIHGVVDEVLHSGFDFEEFLVFLLVAVVDGLYFAVAHTSRCW